jgi:hypothetical protein
MIKNYGIRAELAVLGLLSAFFFFGHTPRNAWGDTGFAQLNSGDGVTLDGKPLSAGGVISSAGLLKTDGTHSAQMTMLVSGSRIFLRPGTSLSVEKPGADGQQTHTLREGMIRAIVSHQNTRYFKIKTVSATMGVRGTDFLAISNPLLGESELIVFVGTVELQSSLDSSDSKSVTQGHWGGVGGRFGQKIGDLITLPPNVLQHFDQISK